MNGTQAQSRAGQGRAGQGRAGQGRAGQGRAGQGRAGQGRAGQGRAGQGRAGQNVYLDIQFVDTQCIDFSKTLLLKACTTINTAITSINDYTYIIMFNIYLENKYWGYNIDIFHIYFSNLL